MTDANLPPAFERTLAAALAEYASEISDPRTASEIASVAMGRNRRLPGATWTFGLPRFRLLAALAALTAAALLGLALIGHPSQTLPTGDVLVVPLADRPVDSIAMNGRPDGLTRTAIWAIARDGSRTRLAGAADAYVRCAEVSPNGRQIVYLAEHWPPDNIEPQLILMHADGTGARPIHQYYGSPGNDQNGEAAWSPDGTRLAFAEGSPDGLQLHALTIDGADTIVMHEPGWFAWAPDGRRLAVIDDTRGDGILTLVEADGSGAIDIAELAPPSTLAGNRAPRAMNEIAWSPDGTQIAYPSGGEIWVAGTDGSPARDITPGFAAAEGGRVAFDPRWSADGRTVGFRELLAARIWTVGPSGDGLASRTIATLGNAPWSSMTPDGPETFDPDLVAWSPDDTSLVALAQGDAQPMVLLPIGGGQGEVITSLSDGTSDIFGPVYGCPLAWARLQP